LTTYLIKRLTKNEYGINVLLINVSSMNLQLLSIPLFLPWANVNARELSVN